MFKNIAVLTSGGDAPGMNPVIRAIVRTSLESGCEVHGISNGFDGIFEGAIEKLSGTILSGMIDRGGTILQSSRCKRFYDPAGIDEAKKRLLELGVQGLVVIGGDGSLTGARELHRRGFPVIGIPASIDNDMLGTEMAIGADTAANTIMQLIDRIRDTARSHRRCFLIEVMGRNSGYLALTTAVSCGAEVAVIPEFACNMRRIANMLRSRFKKTRDNSIIVLAEGVCDADTFIKRMLEEEKGVPFDQEIRKTVLGHVQRGGSPTHFDRVLGARFGEMAVMGLLQGESGTMTGLVKNHVTLVDLDKVIGFKKQPAPELIRLARHLQIEFGDPVE
ncbi:MAG: 6-phosphofructokinase [Chthoniobacterales bacterium]|nr:6-phosphofructokinase [Chthoniobacterales bacterium]